MVAQIEFGADTASCGHLSEGDTHLDALPKKFFVAIPPRVSTTTIALRSTQRFSKKKDFTAHFAAHPQNDNSVNY